MAVVKPFKAMRFTKKAGEINELICPPYDIISENARKEYLKTNEYNIIRLELPRDGAEPYKKAGETLNAWLLEDILSVDENEALYIYEEEFKVKGATYTVKGFTCRVRLEEFSSGVVLPHEETLSKAKTDRLNLMQATKTNFSSIYSLYFDRENTVKQLIEKLSAGKPDIKATDGDGVIHRLWVADGPETAEISRLMADKKIYIADGHHRYETALNYRRELLNRGETVPEDHPANYIMMHLVSMESDGLVVFPTHRIVKGLNDFNPQKLIDGCEKYFYAEPCEDIESELSKALNENKKAFVMYDGLKSTLLILKDKDIMGTLLPEASPACRELDVSILHTLVLNRLLGINKENMANQKNLIYTRDITEAFEASGSGEASCAFIMNPTRVSEIAAVAENNEKMPQKSTYFYPKLITGLVMNPLFNK